MSAQKGLKKRRSWPVRVLKRLLKAASLAILLAAVFSTLFIGFRCYSGTSRPQVMTAAAERAAEGLDGYRREEASTFLTLPEWYIVYNTDEYARFIGTQKPSAFPYVGSIRQYWRYYGGVCAATRGTYQFSWGNHVMLAVIGSSFTIEYIIKGLYENSIGRFAEWTGRDTPEDAFAHTTAAEYGTFMHTVPWYEFPFFTKLKQLWSSTPLGGPRPVRKWERKLALSAEYGAKGIYGWFIGLTSGAAYGAEDLRIHAWVENANEDIFGDGVIKRVKQLGPRAYIVTIPRYEAFTTRSLALIGQGVRFVDIAGNDDILVTVLVPASLKLPADMGAVLIDESLLTDGSTRRAGLRVPVRTLHETVSRLQQAGTRVEHLYDY